MRRDESILGEMSRSDIASLMDAVLKLRHDLEAAQQVADGRATSVALGNSGPIAVPRDVYACRRLTIMLAMRAAHGFCHQTGLAEDLLEPFRWVSGAASDAQIGAKNRLFQPQIPQSRGPDAIADTRIEGCLCAALSRFIEVGKKRKEASETIASVVKQAGIKAPHPRRRRTSEVAEDYEWTGSRILRLFYDVEQRRKTAISQRPTDVVARRLVFFEAARRDTEELEPGAAAEEILRAVIDENGRTLR